MSSEWVYSDVERRCRSLIQFYRSEWPPMPEIRRVISPEYQLTLNFTLRCGTNWDLNPEAMPMLSCGMIGLAITCIGIRCPAVFENETTELQEWLGCRIEIQQIDNDHGQMSSKFQTTVSLKSNDLTEVPIHPPVALSDGVYTEFFITAQVQLLCFFSPLLQK